MPTLEELRAFLAEEFPQIDVSVEATGSRSARVRQTVADMHLRPGGTVSGPVMMALADVAAYLAILSAIGMVPLAVTTSLNINFLNKPAADRALLADAEVIKLGKRLVVTDVRIYSEGRPDLLAQASVTYSVPPRR